MLPASVGNATLQCPNHSTGQCQEPKNLLDRRPVPSTDWSQCGFPLTPFQLLHRKAFAPSSFLTQTPSRRAPFTQAFTQSSFYAQMLLHTDAGTQSSLHPQILLHSEASFCTQTLLQGAAFTQKHFYTEKPLQSSFYTESGSDRVQTGLKITGPRAHPSAGPGRIGDNGENRPKKWKANWSLSSF